MKVNIEEIIGMKKRRADINEANLEDIEWYKDGEKISIDEKTLKDYRFTGLNNTNFIEYEYYLTGPIWPESTKHPE